MGSSTNSLGQPEAFLWDGTSMQALGFLSATFLPRSSARDINNTDQVVGSSFRADGTVEAVLWDAGALIPLGFLNPSDSPSPGFGSMAHAINDSGQIVGASLGQPFLQRRLAPERSGPSAGSHPHPILGLAFPIDQAGPIQLAQ